MRSVRCDVCGTKALVAASTCPKCGHGFENRDGFGELLPLAHCTSCDCYYPHSVGGCRWCGTKPERSPLGPLGPYIWKGFGGLVLASLAIGAWFAKNDTPAPPKPAPRTFVADTLPTNQPKAESFGRKITVAQPDTAVAEPLDSSTAVARADSSRDTAIALSTMDTLPAVPTPVVAPRRLAMQSAGTVVQNDSASSTVDAPPAPPPEPVTLRPAEKTVPRTPATRPKPTTSSAPAPSKLRAAAPVAARPPASKSAPRTVAKTPPPRATTTRAAPAPKSTARAKTRGGWVTSVARNWAVVRSNPTRQSRIIASIGPNTRVQLGETRGEWRRIRTKGLSGWVEHRMLIATAYTPPRSRLAAR